MTTSILNLYDILVIIILIILYLAISRFRKSRFGDEESGIEIREIFRGLSTWFNHRRPPRAEMQFPMDANSNPAESKNNPLESEPVILAKAEESTDGQSPVTEIKAPPAAGDQTR